MCLVYHSFGLRNDGMVIYIIVGGVIGIATTVAVWLIGRSYPLDSISYALVICTVYFIGSLVSFVAHSRITFRVKVPISRFLSHLVVASGSALATSIISSLLRPFVFDGFFGSHFNAGMTDALTFLTAALLVAIISYFLAKVFVFKP